MNESIYEWGFMGGTAKQNESWPEQLRYLPIVDGFNGTQVDGTSCGLFCLLFLEYKTTKNAQVQQNVLKSLSRLSSMYDKYRNEEDEELRTKYLNVISSLSVM